MRRIPIVAIQGGLGNQLFQWFFAHEMLESKRFALYAKFPDGPATNIVRELELSLLTPNCPHFSESEPNQVTRTRSTLIPRIYDYLWNFPFLARPLHALGYFREDPRIDKRVHQSRPRRILYANGYFQNWIYAENEMETIRHELLPVLQGIYADLCTKFDLSQPFTVMHVRRGDYRLDQDPKTMIGTLADQYFIEWTKTHNSDRTVLLTENRADVADLIYAIGPSLVLDQRSTNVWETLAVMSASSVFVGSNSSLSWWGAWTSHLNGGTTYLPSEWDVMRRFNPSDFIFPNCHTCSPVWEAS